MSGLSFLVMRGVNKAYMHKKCCNINTIQTASSCSESSSQEGLHRWKTLLLPLACIQQYHILCSYMHVHVHTYTYSLTHILQYFLYIKKLAQSFNLELHLHCGPVRYDRYRISVVHIILPALKNTNLFGKLKDTLWQQKNSGLLQTYTNGKVMELCSSACLWAIVLLKDLPTSFFLPYQVFFLSGKLQRIARERKRLVNNSSYNEIWLALFYVIPTTHQFTKTGTYTKCNWASKCHMVSQHE